MNFGTQMLARVFRFMQEVRHYEYMEAKSASILFVGHEKLAQSKEFNYIFCMRNKQSLLQVLAVMIQISAFASQSIVQTLFLDKRRETSNCHCATWHFRMPVGIETSLLWTNMELRLWRTVSPRVLCKGSEQKSPA